MTDDIVTLFHSPQSRSGAALVLLEELGAPYKLHVLNMKAGEQRGPEYLAVNPMGKVPAIRHRDALVTEQVAISIYLADAFPGAGLAPAIGDAERGAYLRWLVFYAACFEPAVSDRAMKREAGSAQSSPYGDFDTMYETLVQHLSRQPFFTGERLSAADILWGTALHWMTMFGLVPERPVITDFIQKIVSRPSYRVMMDLDEKLAAEHQAAVVAAAEAAG
ncbi:MAG: glutathione S-transferase family protein [Phreatobacter sp.]|uniref:glutathione S-transferase family protein n=1 Tax=Phreatobacter sp. TaxID=1966341 RepID=UPI001A5BC208|nr:glutathione S-transferase family protein [Phreatobacter sp.]MBL8570452.1 glutathione S-transferase family protein [Phreatobacter sp.]